jgi:hypothetical protein
MPNRMHAMDDAVIIPSGTTTTILLTGIERYRWYEQDF